MKKYKFYYNPQIPAVEPEEEIIEFEDNATEKEIDEAFIEWVFDKLDTAIIPLDDATKQNPLQEVKAPYWAKSGRHG